jgi:hypothetical protein
MVEKTHSNVVEVTEEEMRGEGATKSRAKETRTRPETFFIVSTNTCQFPSFHIQDIKKQLVGQWFGSSKMLHKGQRWD